MIFQDPYESLNPRSTIFEIVAEPLVVHGLARGRDENARAGCRTALEEAGLRPAEDYFLRYPHELSGGQRQRVVIAAAMVLEPELLLADEPVSMLDVSIRAEILNLLRDLRRRRGVSIVFITHDLSTVAYFADRIAVMYLGRIVESGLTARGPEIAAASVYEGAALGGAGAESAPAQRAHHPAGRNAERGAHPGGLPLPSALPGRDRGMQAHRSALCSVEQNAPGCLPAGTCAAGGVNKSGQACYRERWIGRCCAEPAPPRPSPLPRGSGVGDARREARSPNPHFLGTENGCEIQPLWRGSRGPSPFNGPHPQRSRFFPSCAPGQATMATRLMTQSPWAWSCHCLRRPGARYPESVRDRVAQILAGAAFEHVVGEAWGHGAAKERVSSAFQHVPRLPHACGYHELHAADP